MPLRKNSKNRKQNKQVIKVYTSPPNRRFSWQINKLLKLSPLIYQWIKKRVSNGLTCRFWTDNWSPLGMVRQFLQLGSDSSLGIPELTTLASLHTNSGWELPPARSEAQVQLHTMLTMINLTEAEDYYEWEIDGRKCSKYSMGQVYNHLRDQGVCPLVPDGLEQKWNAKT